eukprot:14220070-Ditylum_brightwellii.AAC.1
MGGNIQWMGYRGPKGQCKSNKVSRRNRQLMKGGSPGHKGLPKWYEKEIIKDCKEHKRGITP